MGSMNGSRSSSDWEFVEHDGLADSQKKLLDLIEKIQEGQLEGVHPPRIAAVGGQSAGKSASLHNLTGVPFPRHTLACTRFATEIRLRRSPKENTSYALLPDPKRPFDEQEGLRQRFLNLPSGIPFEEVMKLAVDKLSPKNTPGRFVSEDVLIVKKSGPNMPFLTVVDLPGLVQVPNPDQSKEDITAIKNLCIRYMRSERTIILALISGSIDYSQQEILDLARTFDPTGQRTLGVLTKPDLIDVNGGEPQEERYINLVTNKDTENKFKLGWYVLRNPGHEDDDWSPEERKLQEQRFFSNSRWSRVPRDQRGNAALSEQLSKQLTRLTVRYLPQLKREVEKKLQECEAELAKLGNAKDTAQEMKDDLIDRANVANKIVDYASIGHYIDPAGVDKFFAGFNLEKSRSPPARHLRARINKVNKSFSKAVRAQGDSDTLLKSSRSSGSRMTISDYAERFIAPFMEHHSGIELDGDHQASIVYNVYRKFSDGWAELAKEHISDVKAICTDFITEIVETFYPKFVQQRLQLHYLDEQLKAVTQQAKDEIETLEKDRSYTVKSYDPEYKRRLEAWRLNKVAEKDPNSPADAYTVEEELLAKALIHYELFATTFINNVISQVVERHLIQGLIALFTASRFSKMSDQQIEDIALEDSRTRDRRRLLKNQRAAINESLEGFSHIKMSLEPELRRELVAATEDLKSASDSDSDGFSTPSRERSTHQPKGSPISKTVPSTVNASPGPPQLGPINYSWVNPSNPYALNPPPGTFFVDSVEPVQNSVASPARYEVPLVPSRPRNAPNHLQAGQHPRRQYGP